MKVAALVHWADALDAAEAFKTFCYIKTTLINLHALSINVANGCRAVLDALASSTSQIASLGPMMGTWTQQSRGVEHLHLWKVVSKVFRVAGDWGKSCHFNAGPPTTRRLKSKSTKQVKSRQSWICLIFKCPLMIKCIIILHYKAITPSATAPLGTWLYPPICWLSGRTMTGLVSKESHSPNWQISNGAHRHRAKVGCRGEWHLGIWSVCPLFFYWLSACKRNICGRRTSPFTPGLWSLCFTPPAPPRPCGTRSLQKANFEPVGGFCSLSSQSYWGCVTGTHLIFNTAACNERNLHLCAH